MGLKILFLVLLSVGESLALDCLQYPDSLIYNGSTVYIPGFDGAPQTIPANFNCIYNISVPVNSTSGMYAYVVLQNQLKGLNDYMIVSDVDGRKYTMNNRTGMNKGPIEYAVFPGATFSVQVVTKSVFMDSRFSLTVRYYSAKISPPTQLKTGAEMNYFDMGTLRDGQHLFSSVTFVNNEQISMIMPKQIDYVPTCWDCFVIDGTFTNQTMPYRLKDVDYKMFTSSSFAITIISFQNGFLPFIFNTLSESKQYTAIWALSTKPIISIPTSLRTFYPGFIEAVEVVNYQSNGIVMQDLQINSQNCTAYVVSGPPNNSSQVILDLSTATMPHSFDLKYFSVVNQDCDFSFGVRSS